VIRYLGSPHVEHACPATWTVSTLDGPAAVTAAAIGSRLGGEEVEVVQAQQDDVGLRSGAAIG
jgi:hypothetical protein